tara:strand:- start:434 stop:3322 length:2889 start_codon:yes stop_codon:yes gene_type:complete
MVAYTVTLYHGTNHGNTSDLSDDILSIPIFTDTGDGEVNTATIRLTGKDGKYMTSSPIIEDHDRVKIDVTDSNGLHYIRCFELMAKVPIRNKIEPPTAQIELAGIEICFKRIKCSMNTFELSTRQLYQKLMDTYNENKTTQMPSVVHDVTDIPDIMSNLDWSTEDTILNRLNELVDSFGATGQNNGILDYYDMYFSTPTPLSITIKMFSSGLGPDYVAGQLSPATVTDAIEFEGKVEPSLVNSVGAWGSPLHGSLPTDYSRFKGRQTIMPDNRGSTSNFPEWVNGNYYPIDSRIKYTQTLSGTKYNIVYRKKNNDTNANSTHPPNNTGDWEQVTTITYYGGDTTAGANDIQYSPWTTDKATAWANGGVGTSMSGTGGPFYRAAATDNVQGRCFFDGNLIINDAEDVDASNPASGALFRTWVDFECDTSVFTGTQLKYLYGNSATTGVYKGLRVLVKSSGTPGGTFTADNNKIMEHDGTEWFQKYITETGFLVAVLDSAKVYKWSGSAWDDQDGVENSLDCFHPYKKLENNVGVMLNPDISKKKASGAQEDADNRQYNGVNHDSAITVTYEWVMSEALLGWKYGVAIDDSLRNPSSADPNSRRRFYYSSGAWLNFRFPFPVNNTGISEDIGQLYGGSYASDGTPAKVPYLDLNNSTYTHDGRLGYNESHSEDLGEISSIDFFVRLKYSPPLGDNETNQGRKRYKESSRPFEKGNFPMQVFLIDGDDHVVVQDFNIEFNNTWQEISLPIGGFSLYKGRKPVRATSTTWLFVVPPKELEYIDVFNHRDVRMICINTKDSYDTYGRYTPQQNMFGGFMSSDPSIAKSLQLSIDGLRFTKPLLALTSVVSAGTETVKQSDFLQRPNIFVYDQLEGDTIAELFKQKFPYEEYQLTTEADFVTKYGTYFYATDDFINHTDIVDGNGNRSNGGSANTVVLVAKHIEYSLTKPMKNIGGLIRKVRGVRRFE